MTCELCNVKDRSEFLVELEHCFLLKGPFRNRWPGHVMLVYKHAHIEEQSDVPSPFLSKLFLDIVEVERTVRRFSGAHRINFAKFGNAVSHLHWHIVPRYLEETNRTRSPWELLQCPEAELYTANFEIIQNRQEKVYETLLP